MKNPAHLFVVSLLLLFVVSPVYAQSGIQFFEGSLAEAKAKAEAEGKLLFVESYADWCGPCKLMAREVFSDPEVGAYFNEHFINVKLDMDDPANHPFAKAHRIRSIPDMMFLTSEEGVVNRKLGYVPKRTFLKMAEKAIRKSEG
ncbi:MAG: thioredoxin family protein [Bacteroidota bacterium]